MKKKLLIIGAGGTIGRIITPAFAAQYDLITAGRNSGDIRADITSPAAVAQLFRKTGKIDACICTAGDSMGGSLHQVTDEQLQYGWEHKLLAQIRVVLTGQPYLHDQGSFTLISGKMGEEPAVNATGKAVVNGAVNSFVRAASLEMERGIRLNAVSPAKIETLVREDIIAAYLECVTGSKHGCIVRVGY
ncbi:short chain dehydrogenase [Chitinophaga nivalis]|uniref:Short chain dehydrogenase n=1 Tax=Chitinophaga nivalis TaxID=2991709 RepID=A0ABT3IS96_9BACT|nr:short chain dehydrogenase [Chitinophaga nivalis]MCW3463453.1 short chain dehydrogenase [Chitinophaga nivalis]MCW3486857.1 short chain dehydrogenase [Chitinophaga nivalis]